MDQKRIRSIPLAFPVFDEEMEEAALHALRNERYILGEDVYRFEEEFARYIGAKHAVSTSSGTNALQISLLAKGITRGDEVVTSAFSFVASANAVLHAGATPVFVDVNSGNFNIDPGEISGKITNRTRALLPVHLYGCPCDMDEIRDVAEEQELSVVEDACQAHGALYNGSRAGAISDVGCFSFYPSKNMTVCGDGGMIVTNDEETAKTAAKLRDCGRKTRYEHDLIGYTSRLNTVNAAIGRVQLRRLDGWNRKRVENAAVYTKLLSDLDDIVLLSKPPASIKPVFNLYVVQARNRDGLMRFLNDAGVQCGVHYPMPIPLQPIYRQLFGFKEGEFPVSERASTKCLSLPMYPDLTRHNIEYVCAKIHDFYEKSAA